MFNATNHTKCVSLNNQKCCQLAIHFHEKSFRQIAVNKKCTTISFQMLLEYDKSLIWKSIYNWCFIYKSVLIHITVNLIYCVFFEPPFLLNIFIFFIIIFDLILQKFYFRNFWQLLSILFYYKHIFTRALLILLLKDSC